MNSVWWWALVSGSGPTVAALADGEGAAVRLAAVLAGEGVFRTVRAVHEELLRPLADVAEVELRRHRGEDAVDRLRGALHDGLVAALAGRVDVHRATDVGPSILHQRMGTGDLEAVA